MTFTFDQRLRISAVLIVVGLLIEAWTLRWNSPIGFLVFLGIGGLFIACGIFIYLLALVSIAPKNE
jgi:uncharacterized membrane protein YczE